MVNIGMALEFSQIILAQINKLFYDKSLYYNGSVIFFLSCETSDVQSSLSLRKKL
jgi:hypothetical protein